VLAQELGVSIRTLYRDIASLQSLGRSSMASPAWATFCAAASYFHL